MSEFMITGTVGFNPRPHPHTAHFRDIRGIPKYHATKEENDILREFWYEFGPAGPDIGWLKLKSGTFCTMPYLQQPQNEYLREKTREPGVMGRLQPRCAHNDGTLLYTNRQIASKYFPETFPEHTISTEPASQDLNAQEAKEKNLYYPNQPQIIMLAPLVPHGGFPKCRDDNGNGPCLVRGLMGLLASCQEIKEQIINELDYSSKAALFQTCIAGVKAVSECSTLLDMGSQWFGGNEYTPEEFNVLKSNGFIPKKVEQRGSKYVMLSNTHKVWNEQRKVRPWYSYEAHAQGLCRAFRYFDLAGRYVRQVTIAGIPFLDVYGLAAICELCPKLEKCTAFKNEQIRFQDLPKFFDNYASKENRHDIEFDIAPLYETGPRWSNTVWNGDRDSTHRKGTFGVTHTDSGVKTNVAIVQACIYTLFPALKSAKQEQMMYRPSSLLRQWLEAQALPDESIIRTIAVFEIKQKCDRRIAESEKEWIVRTKLHPPRCLPVYEESLWPESLRVDIARVKVETSFMMAKAMFGNEMWVETFDRGSQANNYRCRVDNWTYWAPKIRCLSCSQSLEHLCFAASYPYCEYCRLQNWVDLEYDHLKRLKKVATDLLGFRRDTRVNEEWVSSFLTLAESNFPKPNKFLMQDLSGKTSCIIYIPQDFYDLVMNDFDSSTMRGFLDAVRDIDAIEAQQGPIGHLSTIQLENPYSGHQPLYGVTWMESLKYAGYRRAPMKEEYQSCGETGYTPSDVPKTYFW